MKKRIIISAAVVLSVLLAVFIFRPFSAQKKGIGFDQAVIKKGDIENIVTSTGTISPVETVAVGSQVSGRIEKILVDFNDTVRKGQLLAILDKTLFKVAVNDAKSNLIKARARLAQAEAELKRNQPLFEKGHISEMEFLVSKTTMQTAQADVEIAEASLNRARTNLAYTEIKSPINGTVIERTVDEGQTIAASFQAPQLFIIARDLKQMQIETNVDESDIGQILEGQSVRFTVQAYLDDTFTGTVRQVRLQPETISNVVNYTVIVDAANPKGQLLPGMTATVDFMIEERRGVLLFPNSALNLNPPQSVLIGLRQQMMERRKKSGGKAFPGTSSGNRGVGRKPPEDMGRFFYLNEKGEIALGFFQKGATDGKNTEVKSSRLLQEGMKIISAFKEVKASAAKSNGSLFMPRRPGGRR